MNAAYRIHRIAELEDIQSDLEREYHRAKKNRDLVRGLELKEELERVEAELNRLGNY